MKMFVRIPPPIPTSPASKPARGPETAPKATNSTELIAISHCVIWQVVWMSRKQRSNS
jgi:hypothetical protein